ncbi:hypothetical protein FQZ97_1156100 [compost metagenome]
MSQVNNHSRAIGEEYFRAVERCRIVIDLRHIHLLLPLQHSLEPEIINDSLGVFLGLTMAHVQLASQFDCGADGGSRDWVLG